MQVVLGPLVSDAAGSIGGTTFQRSPIGAQVRSKPSPTPRRTPYTSIQRPQTQYLSRLWRTLSSADRARWQTEADAQTWYNRFGTVIRGLGYWLFLRCNQYLAMIEGTPVTVPGTLTALDAITDPEGHFGIAADFPISWHTPSAVSAGQCWLVFASRWCSPGRTVAREQTRYIGSIPELKTSPTDLYAEYVTRFGQAPPSGQIVFVTLLPIDQVSGYPGPPVSFIAPT